MYGGPKLFYYDVTQEDLDKTATELVSLGFSTATVEANTGGIGFDIGIGAGVQCDGQILVLHDLLGLGANSTPKFVKQYANLGDETQKAVNTYIQEVRDEVFPDEDHSYKTKTQKLKSVSDPHQK